LVFIYKNNTTIITQFQNFFFFEREIFLDFDIKKEAKNIYKNFTVVVTIKSCIPLLFLLEHFICSKLIVIFILSSSNVFDKKEKCEIKCIRQIRYDMYPSFHLNVNSLIFKRGQYATLQAAALPGHLIYKSLNGMNV